MARIILGLIFFIFGLNGFFHFIPVPAMPQEAEAFMGALKNSGYMLPLIKLVETFCGLIFLTGYYTPLGLLVITPVIYNILFFHIFLAPAGIPLAIVNVVLHGILVFGNYHLFHCLLTTGVNSSNNTKEKKECCN